MPDGLPKAIAPEMTYAFMAAWWISGLVSLWLMRASWQKSFGKHPLQIGQALVAIPMAAVGPLWLVPAAVWWGAYVFNDPPNGSAASKFTQFLRRPLLAQLKDRKRN